MIALFVNTEIELMMIDCFDTGHSSERKMEWRKKAECIIFPQKLLGLLDYFMHKAPYWSVNNYEKRVEAGVCRVFLRHVEGFHKENREELAGISGCASLHHDSIVHSLPSHKH